MIYKIEKIVSRAKSETEILQFLNDNKISFWRDAKSDYFNIKIKHNDIIIRIYKPYRSKKFECQKMQKITLNYSGIPTFFDTKSYF